MSIDLKHVLRKRKPAKYLAQLVPQPRRELIDFSVLSTAPVFLLLDTNVYINRAAGRLTRRVSDAIDQALLFHSSVALSELAVGVGNFDPSRPGWSAMRDHYSKLFSGIPVSRVVTPDAQVWTDAGVIAGTIARTQRLQPHQRKECLNDALIFLTAAKAGLPVLTANRDEFDFLQQIAPEGRFIYY